MLSLKTVYNTINDNEFYRRFTKIPLIMNWGWLISFLMISLFNGWMINVSSVQPRFLSIDQILLKQIIVIYFAVFPLAATVYIFFKSTKILVFSIIASQTILAVALCYIKLPNFSPIFISFLIYNILLFIFVLTFVCKTRGFVVPLFILFFAIVLIVGGQGRLAFHLVWYCNLIVTVNKSGKQLRNILNSFDAAILSLSGIASVGLAVGWLIGGFSAS